MTRAEWYEARQGIRRWVNFGGEDREYSPHLKWASVAETVIFRPPYTEEGLSYVEDKLMWRANCRGPFTVPPSSDDMIYASCLEIHGPLKVLL